MQKTEIKYREAEGRISLKEGNTEIAFLSFELVDRRLIRAMHTVVAPEHQGQGLARRLVEVLVGWARERSLLIEPVCSYVAQVAKRDEALQSCLEDHSEAGAIISTLQAMGDTAWAEQTQRFFKTGRGEYGEGDVFLGISVPRLRAILRKVSNPPTFRRRNLSRATLIELWHSPYHEARALAYYALADWAERASDDTIEEIYSLYMEHIDRCNNWDLVDCSAPQVVGRYLITLDADTRRQRLLALAQSGNMWVQRIAVVGTLGLIRRGIYEDTFVVAEALLDHTHDLIHKAIGWSLREVGKHIGKETLTDWLEVYASRLPRTALSYAVEHLEDEERKYYRSLR